MAAPTEASRFWTTGGAGDGASTYTRDQLAEAFRNLTLGDNTTEGVLIGLAVSGSASPLTLAVGAALVYGYVYVCTVAGDVPAITTPAVGTTGFRVVLRADWTAQTVRVAVVKNTDGVSAIPAVTQTAGTTWEITLATGTITTGGVITLTDARAYAAAGPSAAALSVIGRSANTAGVINEITAAADNEVLRRSGTSIGFGQVATDGIADSAVTAAKIANRTRYLWITPHNPSLSYQTGAGLIMPDAQAVTAYGSFYVPADYVSGGVIVSQLEPDGTGNVRVFSDAYYGAVGEAHDANLDQFTTANVAVTAGAIANIASITFSALAAGDSVMIQTSRVGNNAGDTIDADVNFRGWLFSYTADS